jgi:hypothetical protein
MVGDIISERVGDFKSEWWARSSRNPGRHRSESAFVSKNDYQVLTAILENSVTTADVGIEAGFANKQAEAVGLDRCRTAILAANEAFEIIDLMEASHGVGWLYRLPKRTFASLACEAIAAFQ